MGLKRIGKKLKRSVFNPKVAIKHATTTAKAGLKGSFKDKRANLRANHVVLFEPFSKPAQQIIHSRELARSADPNVQAEGVRLRNEADRQTLKQGKIGIAVGAVVVGGAAIGGTSASGTAASAGGAAGGTAGAAGGGGTFLGFSTGSIVKAAVPALLGLRGGSSGAASANTSNTDELADSSLPNGSDYYYNGYADRSVDSAARNRFFSNARGGSAAATAGGLSSCGCVSTADSLGVIGIIVMGVILLTIGASAYFIRRSYLGRG